MLGLVSGMNGNPPKFGPLLWIDTQSSKVLLHPRSTVTYRPTVNSGTHHPNHNRCPPPDTTLDAHTVNVAMVVVRLASVWIINVPP
jgi:hypothetical protein